MRMCKVSASWFEDECRHEVLEEEFFNNFDHTWQMNNFEQRIYRDGSINSTYSSKTNASNLLLQNQVLNMKNAYLLRTISFAIFAFDKPREIYADSAR